MIVQNPQNRRQVAAAIHHLLNAGYALNIFKRLMETLLWSVTCDLNKKDDIKYAKKYWSQNAIDLRKRNIEIRLKQKSEGKKQIDKNKGLTHEHTIPKSLILDKLSKLKTPTETDIFNMLNAYEFAVVITKEEDNMMNAEPYRLRQSLPNGYSIDDDSSEELILSRYIACQIPLFEINLSNFSIIAPKLSFNENVFTVHEDSYDWEERE